MNAPGRLGAGEVLATSVDRNGTGDGYELELSKLIADLVSIPVLAHGGPGTVDYVSEVIEATGVNTIASLLHCDAVSQIHTTDTSDEDRNTEFLKRGRTISRIDACRLHVLKENLAAQTIKVRI